MQETIAGSKFIGLKIASIDSIPWCIITNCSFFICSAYFAYVSKDLRFMRGKLQLFASIGQICAWELLL